MANEFIARKGLIALDDTQVTGSISVSSTASLTGLQYPLTDGVDRQVIKTDGNGVLSFGYSENTSITVKNVSGGTIPKGTPCYITASGTSGNVAGIIPADASDITKMPAAIIAGEELANGDEGEGLVNGFIQGVDTSAFTSGDTVYVAVGGGYTNVRPTGSGVYIQKLGNVEKSHDSNGSGVIAGPNYYNELPNWETGKVMVGTDTYPVTSSVITLDESNTKLTIEGSGSTIFEVVGSEGQLFSITDSLSGSLFAVSDVSGLPILEVFSDDTVKIGTFNNEAIIVNGSTSIITGSFTGSFVGDGSGLTGIPTADGVISSSAQIATEISGAFTSTSASIAADIATNVSDISTNTSNISSLTSATSSYITSLPSGVVSSSAQVNLGSATGTIDISTQTNLAVGNGITLTGDTLTVTAGVGLTQTAGGLTFDADGGTLTTNNADVDHILINDGGTFKRITKGNINVGDFNNNAGYLTSVPAGTISSSAQVDHDQTANFSADEHFTQANITTVGTVTSGNITAILPSGVVSSSAQIATEISGAFTSTSASIAADIATNAGDILGLDNQVSFLTTSASLALATASYAGDTLTFEKGDGSTFDITGIGGGLWSEGTGNDIYYIDGQVGIGTGSPDHQLFVSGADQCLAVFKSSTNGGGIVFMDNGTTDDFSVGIGAFDDNLCFLAGGNQSMRILDTGEVGIGTLTPTEALQVVGNVSASGFIGDLTGTADTASYVAGALMDSEVDADIKTLSLPANTTISTFGASLIDDANNTTARTTLGLGSIATAAAGDYVSINGDTLNGTLDLDTNDIINAGSVRATTISGSTFVSDGVTIVSIPDVQTVKLGQSAGGSGPMKTSIVSNNVQYGLFSSAGIELTGSVSISDTLSIPGFADVSASLAAAVAGGDDLGNHTATQNLNMGGYSITNALNITSSGNISASGDLYSTRLNLPQAAGSGIVFGEQAGDSGFMYDDGNKLWIGYNDSDIISIHDADGDNVEINGNLTTTSHITASGNISASGDLIANRIQSSQITGSNSAAFEITNYEFGYELIPSLPITGSGIIIRETGLPADNYPMLKIGDVEMIDINSTFSPNVFFVHNVDSIVFASGSEPVDIYGEGPGKLFEHNGDVFKVYSSDTLRLTIDSAGSTFTNTVVMSSGSLIKSPLDNNITYLAGWTTPPGTTPQELYYIPTSSIRPLTASYAENGVTINNNTDNYIVTATGTTGTLNGETNFRIDSGELSVGVNGYITFTPGDGGRKSGIHYDADADFETTSTLFMGTTVKVGATLSTTAGKLYNLSGSWAEADASSVSTSTGFLGVALQTATTNTFLTEGMYNLLSSQVGGTYSAGAPLYISETGGTITFTPPTTSGAIVRIIGHAIDSYTSGTTWYKIYLKPSNEWIELA